MKIAIYCVFLRDEDDSMVFMHAFDTADAVDEYIFENENLELAVETVFVNVPKLEK